MMNANDVNRYIGIPWHFGARGPDEYDCWGLLKTVRDTYFGGGIPDTPLGDPARELYAEKLRTGLWEIVSSPAHGDGVLLRDEGEPHVGIYLDFDGGGILHSMRGAGVIFTELRELRIMGFANPRFYRIHG